MASSLAAACTASAENEGSLITRIFAECQEMEPEFAGTDQGAVVIVPEVGSLDLHMMASSTESFAMCTHSGAGTSLSKVPYGLASAEEDVIGQMLTGTIPNKVSTGHGTRVWGTRVAAEVAAAELVVVANGRSVRGVVAAGTVLFGIPVEDAGDDYVKDGYRVVAKDKAGAVVYDDLI
ncbi:MAG: hypothetical protein ABIQ18_29580 [Umezawaea sp.]